MLLLHLLLTRVRDQRQGLQGLAEAHVVGQHPAQPVAPEEGQPVESALLVGAELGCDPRRQGGRGHVLHVAEALDGLAPGHRLDALVSEVVELGPE